MNEATKTMKSLKDRAKEFSVQLPFMDGREKGEFKKLVGQICTIRDYGFLKDDNGRDYVVFILDERIKEFFFGGEVLTDQMTQLEAEGYRSAINDEGLPTLFTEKKSKNGRTYMNVTFFPEDEATE